MATEAPAEARTRTLREVLPTRVLLVLVPLQILAPFLGVPLALHGAAGAIIALLALWVAVQARHSHASRDLIRLTTALALLFLLQLGLFVLGRAVDALGFLHGINGILIFAVTLVVAIEAEEQ